MVEDRYEGYLYVVLASAARRSLLSQVATSSALRQGLVSLTLAVTVALLAGLLLFRSLTRPLRALTARMETFRSSDFTRPPPLVTPPGGDEIAELERTFAAMSERIIQQVQRLKQTDELRRELVANVSHDLRTPLAALQGYLETLVLKNGSLDPAERERFLAVATGQAARLGHLVEELFELARLESAEVRPSIEPFPLAELVQDVVHEFRIQAEQAGVTLTARLPEDLPLVAADIGLMQRVLQNLLSNALRHTEPGGSVTVVVHPEPQRVVVRVEDTGCGIPADDLERVFDRFYQASTGGRTRPRIGGLGLAIVRRILELHGSAIEAASQVGEGTAFSFALPAVA
jgi:signal transduction histidine kinase